MTNSEEIHRELQRRCDHRHGHQPLVSGRAKLAAIYPSGLCQAICRGLLRELSMKEGSVKCLLSLQGGEKISEKQAREITHHSKIQGQKGRKVLYKECTVISTQVVSSQLRLHIMIPTGSTGLFKGSLTAPRAANPLCTNRREVIPSLFGCRHFSTLN